MTTNAARRGRSPAARMSTWRLEWLRLVRSPRAVTLGGVYVFFGLLGPVTAKYLEQIIHRAQPGVRVSFPPPTPATGISNYISQASQTGLIVAIVIAAAALSFDSRSGLSTFLRSRASSIGQLIAPRFAVSAAAVIAAYLLGTLAAWYETILLIGSPPAGAMLTGMLCGSAYLLFAITVTAAAAALARSTLGAVAIAVAALLALPLLGMAGPVHDWLPSTLVNAPVELLGTAQLTDFIPALAVCAATGALLMLFTAARLRAREV